MLKYEGAALAGPRRAHRAQRVEQPSRPLEALPLAAASPSSRVCKVCEVGITVLLFGDGLDFDRTHLRLLSGCRYGRGHLAVRICNTLHTERGRGATASATITTTQESSVNGWQISYGG
jgi:hypothetical protein